MGEGVVAVVVGPDSKDSSPRLERVQSLAPHERLPELPVVPRKKTHTGAAARENPRDAPVISTRARTLEAGKRWARLAQARAASRPGLGKSA